ncbi:MAG: ABC transporter ATP-binding protein [Acidobacteriota bacterium]
MKIFPRFSNVWSEASQLVWERRRRLSLGFVLMLVNRLSGLIIPGSSKILIDEVVAKQRGELLPLLAIAAVGATLLQAATSFVLARLLGLAAQVSITEMKIRLQQHVMRLPVAFFDSTKSGKLVSRIMSDAEGLRNLVGSGLLQLIGGLVTAGISVAVLFYLNWRLSLIVAGVAVIFGGAVAYTFSRIRPIFREKNRINAEVTGRLAESLGGIRIVKAYNAEKHEDWVFARGAHLLLRNVERTITAVSGFTALSIVLFGSISVVLILVGSRSILDGSMTLGDFVTYIFFTGMVVAPLIQAASTITQLSQAFAGLDRIRELKRLHTEEEENQGHLRLPQMDGEVVFENVSFEYKQRAPVLKQVSFRAPAGSTTALVGPSGAGKSTLISLIMAFHRPQEGKIFIDRRDLASIRLADFRSHLGVVLQDNFLFDGTIAENIGYARPRTDRKDLLEAARIAHCDEFVNTFEDKLDTVIGERGVKLSGGQRQRVAIARAILANPRILILDEATSSLDSESEALIQDGLRSLRRGRTTFVIAHRLSTIRSADQILVMEEGAIVERGTHQQLLAAGGRYRQLYETQYQVEHDRFVNPGEDLTPEPPERALPPPEPPTERKLL